MLPDLAATHTVMVDAAHACSMPESFRMTMQKAKAMFAPAAQYEQRSARCANCNFLQEPAQPNIGALIFRIGFWVIIV